MGKSKGKNQYSVRIEPLQPKKSELTTTKNSK